jgi:hypothetical protein
MTAKHQNYTVIRAASSNPDPATYCPANGYYDPNVPIPYNPDPAIPAIVPNDGEIILLMSTALDAAINTYVSISDLTQARYTIYGANDTVIYTTTVNNNTTFFYEFPSSGGILLSNGFYAFKVVITAATTGTITVFRFMTKSAYAPNGWPVLEAHIKCPTLTSLESAFLNQKALRYVKFYGNHNSLTLIGNIVNGCSSLQEFHADVQMNALTSISYAFNLTSAIELITLPPTMNFVTNASYAFQSCGLKYCPPLPNALPENITARQMMYNMARCAGTVYVPDMPKCTDMVYVASLMPLVTKIICRGSCIPNTGSAISSFANCASVREIEMGISWGEVGVNWSYGYVVEGCPSLTKLTLPLYMKGIAPGNSTPFTQYGNFSCIELTTADWTDCTPFAFSLGLGKITSLNQPTLKVTNLSIAGSASRPSKLEYIEINWAGSSFPNSAGAITLGYNNLSAAELNRIYTALPAGGGTTTITASNNPGYAASDKTIATAKGWIVN